jgi:hypothetical protein
MPKWKLPLFAPAFYVWRFSRLPKVEDVIGKPLSHAITKYVNELYADILENATVKKQ